MKRYEAIKTILKSIGKDEPALFTTGFISREAYNICDRDLNFYMVGSMGLLSAVGTGIALSCPEKNVFIIEGDGSAFMCLGNLALIGSLKVKNIVHIILDNGEYSSTGGQECISSNTDIASIAKGCGYKYTAAVKNSKEFLKLLNSKVVEQGPVLIRVNVSKDYDKNISRVKLPCEKIKKRFMKALNL
ncbi:MAG: thiamine pyrophosphate-dependent enzyme [Armatimonadota bacterium]